MRSDDDWWVPQAEVHAGRRNWQPQAPTSYLSPVENCRLQFASDTNQGSIYQVAMAIPARPTDSTGLHHAPLSHLNGVNHSHTFSLTSIDNRYHEDQRIYHPPRPP